MKMKKITVWIFLVLILASCENDDKKYYTGYHNAWDKVKNEKRYQNDIFYKKGYDKGDKDAGHFFQGCEDAEKTRGQDNRLSKFDWYKKGYQECQKAG